MLVAQRPKPRIEKPAPLVKRFLDYLFLECGLAGSTVTTYQRVLGVFWDHLIAREVEPGEISIDDVREYLIEAQERGLAVATVARDLATVKVFLRFLFAERVLRRDIASLIESPKRWRYLPETVRLEQVEALLAAPDPRDEFYLRDRALLELLYATGMRVSEVVDLTLDQINLKLGYVRCIGKGRKERVVPVGRPRLFSFPAPAGHWTEPTCGGSYASTRRPPGSTPAFRPTHCGIASGRTSSPVERICESCRSCWGTLM